MSFTYSENWALRRNRSWDGSGARQTPAGSPTTGSSSGKSLKRSGAGEAASGGSEVPASAAPAVFRLPRSHCWICAAAGLVLVALLLVAILEPGWLLQAKAFVPAWRRGMVLVLSSAV